VDQCLIWRRSASWDDWPPYLSNAYLLSVSGDALHRVARKREEYVGSAMFLRCVGPRLVTARRPVADQLSSAAANVSGRSSNRFAGCCTPRISTSIEQFVHFLARPKSGQVLFRHQDVVVGTGVASRPRPALLGQENSEPAELHPIETRERLGNFAEYRVNDILDVALIQMWIARGEPLHQFGLDQDNAPLVNQRANAPILRINFATIGYALEHKQGLSRLNAAEPVKSLRIFRNQGLPCLNLSLTSLRTNGTRAEP
jgi:hypothetical protein